MINTTRYQGNTNQHQNEVLPNTCQMAIIKRPRIKNVEVDVKKEKLPYAIGGSVNYIRRCEHSTVISSASQKWNSPITQDLPLYKRYLFH